MEQMEKMMTAASEEVERYKLHIQQQAKHAEALKSKCQQLSHELDSSRARLQQAQQHAAAQSTPPRHDAKVELATGSMTYTPRQPPYTAADERCVRGAQALELNSSTEVYVDGIPQVRPGSESDKTSPSHEARQGDSEANRPRNSGKVSSQSSCHGRADQHASRACARGGTSSLAASLPLFMRHAGSTSTGSNRKTVAPGHEEMLAYVDSDEQMAMSMCRETRKLEQRSSLGDASRGRQGRQEGQEEGVLRCALRGASDAEALMWKVRLVHQR